MASWRVHRGVEWCPYDPQTPRETRDTRIFRMYDFTRTIIARPVNRAKRRVPSARSGSGTLTIQVIIIKGVFK